MVDPFNEHPNSPQVQKKDNNILTLQEVRDTINKQCEEIMSSPDQTWGFTRYDILEYFDKLLGKLEDKCLKRN